MVEVVVTTAATRRAKLQSNRHHQQTNTQLFTSRMPFLSPNQQCQRTAEKGIILHGIACLPQAHRGLPTWSLTTKGYWLPWEGLISLALVSQPAITGTPLFISSYCSLKSFIDL